MQTIFLHCRLFFLIVDCFWLHLLPIAIDSHVSRLKYSSHNVLQNLKILQNFFETPHFSAIFIQVFIHGYFYGVCQVIQVFWNRRFFSAITWQLMWKGESVVAKTTTTVVNCVQEMHFYKLNTTLLPYEGKLTANFISIELF